MYESCIKRLLDLILSLAACVVLAIPMGIIALWIKKDSPGPVFFKQRRVGRGKKCFNILKFRTMRGDTPHDVPTHLLKNADSYITKSGAFLRRTSLDELPQIYNIVAGQMSIIGPRPALYNQYDLIAARDAVHANDIRPGLTGLAQINGRWLPPDALRDGPAGGFVLLALAELRQESSTELRRRIAAGEAWQDWVPAAVAAHIESLHLYRNPAVILAAPPSSHRP